MALNPQHLPELFVQTGRGSMEQQQQQQQHMMQGQEGEEDWPVSPSDDNFKVGGVWGASNGVRLWCWCARQQQLRGLCALPVHLSVRQ